ncbi:acetolactate decarboxylase [Ekhidna lutea]|uniref:Acetolactate decarboxylase n=2 Tax=Ekhidna lutea TaxID=447679 RepID=A0A239KIZ4_EKHLU|nr:acetolactate decarboxylase [Ekhidna lutea]
MRNMYFILIALFLLACSKPNEYPIVKNIGELRKIMHQGEFQARVSLDTLVKKELYGLGAQDSLSGEILVIDGEVFRSYLKNDTLITQTDQSVKATLFVYTSVTAWDTVDFSGISDIELQLEKSQDLSKAFPFILLGSPSVDYHVINFNPKNGDISKHKEGAFRGSIQNEPLTILGFYSKEAKGIYTHHDSNLHMHVINTDRSVMGHVDQINIEGRNMKLILPREVRN